MKEKELSVYSHHRAGNIVVRCILDCLFKHDCHLCPPKSWWNSKVTWFSLSSVLIEEVTEEHATLSQTDRNSNTVAGHLIIIVIFAILIIIVILTTLIAHISMVLSLYKRCFCCNAAPEAQGGGSTGAQAQHTHRGLAAKNFIISMEFWVLVLRRGDDGQVRAKTAPS